MNLTLKDDIKRRDTLLLLNRRYPTLENKEKYKQFHNRNVTDQRKAERNYYIEQYLFNIKDLKKSWKIIKHMFGKEDSGYAKYQIDFLINDQYISNSNTIENSFTFFLLMSEIHWLAVFNQKMTH